MAIPKAFERRISRRKKLTGLLPGRLSLKEGEAAIHCKPVDVSDHGLGLISDAQLEVGTQLKLTMPEEVILFKVVWKQPDFGKSDLYRFGLEIVAPKRGFDLEELFEQMGCLC